MQDPWAMLILGTLFLAKEAHLFLKQASASSKTVGRLFTPLETTPQQKKKKTRVHDEFHIEKLSVAGPVTVPSNPGTLVDKENRA